MRAKTLGETSTFEIVVEHDVDLTGLELDLSSTGAITNFTSNDVDLDWATFTNTIGTSSVDLSFDQAISGTGTVSSGAVTVIAEFSVTGDAEINLNNVIGVTDTGSTANIDDQIVTLTSQELAGDGTYDTTISKGNNVQIGFESADFTRDDWVNYSKPITWQDAYDALLLSAGSTTNAGTKTEQDLIAANINGDQKVTWQDALNILYASAGSGYETANGPKLVAIESGFTDSDMTYRNVDMSSVTTIDTVSVDTTLDLDVILVGDVNGLIV